MFHTAQWPTYVDEQLFHPHDMPVSIAGCGTVAATVDNTHIDCTQFQPSPAYAQLDLKPTSSLPGGFHLLDSFPWRIQGSLPVLTVFSYIEEYRH